MISNSWPSRKTDILEELIPLEGNETSFLGKDSDLVDIIPGKRVLRVKRDADGVVKW